MSSNQAPSDQLLDFWIAEEEGLNERIILGPIEVEDDPKQWQPNFRKAGINLRFDLGDVKIQVIHYVWKVWKKERRDRVLLKPDLLSGNKKKKKMKDGESTFGFSPRTYSAKIQELVSDGYLNEVGRDKTGSRFVIPGWSLAVAEEPVSSLKDALARQRYREALGSLARRRGLGTKVQIHITEGEE